MAVSSRTFARQRDYSKLFISLAMLAAIVAIAPIVAAALGYGSSAVRPKTAFATAPNGDYAVIGRTENDADVISVAWASSPGAVTEIARIPHLDGFASTGAVSPDGKLLALVTVDGGSATHPKASLKVVGLESGEITNVLSDVRPQQIPVWSPGSKSIVAVMSPASESGGGTSTVIRVHPDGDDAEKMTSFNGVLGVYPLGFRDGQLAMVVVDSRGSTLRVGDADWGSLSSNITRDWKLSPDGGRIAFIDVETAGGVRYVAREVDLAGGGVSAQSLAADVTALGTAWNPKTKSPAFGVEPAMSEVAGVSVQALAADVAPVAGPGFDVPMGYSNDGDHLFVTRWSGTSFQEPGKATLQIVSPGGRVSFESFTRFYGWATR